MAMSFVVSSAVGSKSMALEEQLPEHFYWGLEFHIFNDTSKKEAFLKELFSPEEIEKIGSMHLCLYQKEIEDQNAKSHKFDEDRLNRFLTQSCMNINDSVFFLVHPKWRKLGYLSADGQKICLDKSDCAVVLEGSSNRLVLGWIRWGVEVFEKIAPFKYRFTNATYDLTNYAEQKGVNVFKDYTHILPYSGGLGNQLFYYWSGVIHALKNNKTPYMTHALYLHEFLDLPFKKENSPIMEFDSLPEFLRRYIYENIGGVCRSNHHVPFDQKCIKIGGFLQSWKNFVGYEDYIREHMVFTNHVQPKSQEIMKKMKNENAVSIHVRRGDYVWQGYILLTQNYYNKAIKYIKQNVKNPHFYIFSNDINWVKENLTFDGEYTIIDWTKRDYEDLQLMSKCKHFINANSSFSWWGSFLSDNKNKIIISPDKHASWDFDWIKYLLAPNFVTIDVEKHWWDRKVKKYVTID